MFLLELVPVYICFLRVVYAVMKLFPQNKHKIVFLSRQTNMPSIDFRMLSQELIMEDESVQVVMLCRRIEKHTKDVVLNTGFILRQMYHLATAQTCVIDGYNIPVSVLKHRENLRVVQIWHALGAIKKFGRQVLKDDQSSRLARLLKIHQNYSTIIAPSKATSEIYRETFGYDEANFEICQLPRADYLSERRNINREKIYRKYPELRGKKVMLYAPTFRNVEGGGTDLAVLERQIPDEFVLIVKLHANVHETAATSSVRILTCDEFTTLQLMSIADAVITDYSAIAFEAATLNIPLYFYVYDLEKYYNDPGLNIDPSDMMPASTFRQFSQIVESIRNNVYDWPAYQAFREEYLTTKVDGERYTTKLARIVLGESDA